jgi:hypothetical protein
MPDMALDAAIRSGRRRNAVAFQPCGIRNNDVALFVPAKAPMPGSEKAGPRQSRNRAHASVIVSRKARQDFLDALMLCGDPALCADRLGLSLVRLVRLRAEDTEFVRQWQAAMAFAWERVEHRLLAQLLDSTAPIDSKLALAAIGRRDPGAARVQGGPVDSASVARVRAELRALTGFDAATGVADQ